ncbi:helix-turn-helix transcriptional regulator [Sulfitobacter pontiacus]
MHPDPEMRFLRMPEVEAKVGLKKRTIQYMVKEGAFPEPVQLNERSIGFVESEVNAWMLARMEKRVEIGDNHE